MLTIKILGGGCENCNNVEAAARRAVDTLGLTADFIHVRDQAGIHAYPILATPGLVINEKLVCAGRVPADAEVIGWVKAAQN